MATLLLAAGEPRADRRLVIAAFAIGGMIIRSASARAAWLGQKGVMISGSLLIALGLAIVALQPPWPVQCAAFGVIELATCHASIGCS